MNILVRRSCLSIIVLSALIEVIQSNKNESNIDARQGRVTGRIVKLYSGYKPDPVICQDEGFKADPKDCSIFYRCVKASHRGNFNIFRYQCGPGTVYDPETEICNHPQNTKRSECGGLISSHDINDENEDNEVGQELPSPISTNLPFFISHQSPSNTTVLMLTTRKPLPSDIFTKSTIISPYPIMTTVKYEVAVPSYPWTGSRNETYQVPLTTAAPLLEKSDSCVSDGFIGDHENCRKFYRCVRNSYGSFTRHEFFCSEPTIWDDSIQSCNHVWAARNSRCGRNNADSFKVDVISQNIHQQFNYGSKTTDKYNYSKFDVSKPHNSKYSTTVDINKEEFSDSGSDVLGYNRPLINQSLNENNGIRKETTYFNEEYDNKEKQTTKTVLESKTPTQIGNVGKSVECSQSGFMGDPSDCSKFYRCVDNGNGKFMKYEFSCSQGTVWDNKAEACNHAWAVKECGGSSQIEDVSPTSRPTTNDTSIYSSTSTTYKTIITSTSTIANGLINENNDNGYFNPTKFEEETTMPTTVSLIASTTSASLSFKECNETNFFGDQNNCQIFYRCVDNGKGGFTKFEYKCGEGTLWDQDIEACNHAWAVKSCGLESSTHITKTTKVSDKGTTNSYVQATTISVIPGNNYNPEYNTQETETEKPDKNLINNVPSNSSMNKNICKNSGFIGDSNDCRKFYRCVDNGNEGFTQHEFLCGYGTVWDSSIEACNHALDVKTCGGSIELKEENQNGSQSVENQNMEVTTHYYYSHSTISSSEMSSNDVSSGYVTQNYNTQHTTSKPLSSTISSISICRSDGFVGDKNDCKKFYRCVKKDNGGYQRYDFHCGDGTLWDPKIQACNHEWAVNECSGSVNSELVNNITETNIKPTESFVEESENSYTSQISSVQENVSSTTTIRTPTLTTSATLSKTEKCRSSGFIGDENDCKKFYRCVENDDGKFTAYEFVCGEGTVWDSEITACNHEWAVDKCNSNHNEPIKTTQPTQVGDAQSTSATISTLQSSVVTSSTQMSHTPILTSTLSSTLIDSSPEEGQQCDSEGFFSNKNDCRKFFRCVNNGKGSYDKYEFDCGEGTIWVQEIQACDHDTLGTNCTLIVTTSTESHKVTSSTSMPSVSNTPNEVTIISTTDESKPDSEEAMQMNCQDEGYFGNINECRKFYRCVNDGKGGFIKYDYICGEGTIWDSEIIACNHPQDVSNPSCSSQHENSSEMNGHSEYTTTEKSTESTMSASKSTTEPVSTMKETQKPAISSTTSPGTTSSLLTTSDSTSSSTNCSNNNATENSDNQDFKCDKAGFYSDKYDCKKFHRCVDWDGSGNKFSVYHFECGDGTIWDPALETCNHASSVIPPRNCNGSQQENVSETVTTTEKSTTINYETTQKTTTLPSTTEVTTTQLTSTEQSTAQSSSEQPMTQSSSSEPSTTQSSSSEPSTTQSSSSEQSTTQSSSSEQSTTQLSSSEQSTTQSSSSEQSTTQSSSSEQSTTQSSSSEQSTTQESTEQSTQSSTTVQFTEQPIANETQSTTTEQTTTQSSQEQTTKLSTEQTNSTEETLSTESTTETTHLTSISTDQTTTEQTNTSTDQSTTEDNISQITEVQSTTSESTTTESSPESTSQQECPETDSDQSLFVCPTSFKRHPKYCNLFYQCVEDSDSHEVKLTVFNCPNNTIYDESKIQCVEEDKSDKKCNGKISQKHRVKRLGSMFNEPITVTTNSMACSSAGHFPFEIQEECSEALLKCESTKSGKLRGYVYKCPKGFVYWTVSRRCESIRKVRDCKRSSYPWNSRYDLPIEIYNIAS